MSGLSTIAKAYWRSIKRGTRTYAEVPLAIKDEVRELADEDLAAGVITQADYDRLIG